MSARLTAEQLEALRRLDTCTLANAIETFEVRLRNEGFTDSSIRCLFPKLAPMVGYAVTVTIRCSGPPPEGHNYLERTDWWNSILTIPAPRVVVFQDIDRKPGTGALIGEVHCNILRALGCVGAVTNGAVRDLPAVEAAGFQLFAGHIAVSHSYAHIVKIGGPVKAGGLEIKPGELLHGDCHGVVSIPTEIAGQLPSVAAQLMNRERKLIALCRSGEFSLENLRRAVKEGP